MATELETATFSVHSHAASAPDAGRYRAVRGQTMALCQPLQTEDYLLQPMTEASPVKWHIAHTTWFFETFVLQPHQARYRPDLAESSYLFNSYYNAFGERIARNRRSLMSRPTLDEVRAYRDVIDTWMVNLLEDDGLRRQVGPLVELGLQHEQQHQELILTDLKAAFACNPLRPTYREDAALARGVPAAGWEWVGFGEGLRRVGHDGRGFAFDNEVPRHRAFVEAFELATRLTVNEEYLAFVEAGGYERPEFWLSDGWAVVQTQGWKAPLYWEQIDGRWQTFTLSGLQPLALEEPVAHLSYYEADAFARWSGARLPTEVEWEVAVEESQSPIEGNFVECGRYHPSPALESTTTPAQLFGDVWEWTSSPYTAYPGFRPAAGALGEYNGKFMCNQFVLRGGSCVTPRDHIRATYRNFFPPESRWQFSGVRLARDARR